MKFHLTLLTCIIILCFHHKNVFAQYDCSYNQTLNSNPISTITYERFEVENKISSTGSVIQAQQTEFSAGNSIHLEAGFLVKPGATFLAEIEGCVNSCPDANPCPDVTCFENYPLTNFTVKGLEYYQHDVIISYPDSVSIIANIPGYPPNFIKIDFGQFAPQVCVDLDTLFRGVAAQILDPNKNGTTKFCLCDENIIKYTNPYLIFDETGPRQANCDVGNEEGGGRFSLNYVYEPVLPAIDANAFLMSPNNIQFAQNPNPTLVAILDTGITQEFLNDLPSDVKNGFYITATADEICEVTGLAGWNFVNNNKFIRDDRGHGTLVAANYIEALNKMNDPFSVQPEILVVKVLDSCGRGNTFDAICGIKYAEIQGAEIMNISWGLHFNDEQLQRFISHAANSGMHIVCSAGNGALDLSQNLHFPSGYANEFEKIKIDGNTITIPGLASVYEVGGLCKVLDESCQPNPINMPLWEKSNYDDFLFVEPAIEAQHLINYYLTTLGEPDITCNFNGTSFAAPIFAAGITYEFANPNFSKAKMQILSSKIHPDFDYYSYYLSKCN